MTERSPAESAAARRPSTLASQGGTPVRDRFLPLALPWIGDREKQLVLEALESGWITTGPRTHELAQRIAQIAGARHAVCLNSATGALHLALEAMGIGEGDEVITSTWTFAASVNVIEHVRAKPVLVDVEPDTLCLDPGAVERATTPRTRVILSVDYGGHPCDYRALRALADRTGSGFSMTRRTRSGRAIVASRSARPRSRRSRPSRSMPPRT